MIGRLQRITNDPSFGTVMMLAFLLALTGLLYQSYILGGVDFRGYYAAASLVRSGGNPYDYSQLAPVLNDITGTMGNNPYYYPPWFCLIFIPLTFVSFQVARVLWILANGVLFFISMKTMHTLLPVDELWKRWGISILGMMLFTVNCFRSEQAGILLLSGLVMSLSGIRSGRPWVTAFGLVLMITKPQATGFAVLFLALWLFFNQRKSLYYSAFIIFILLAISSVAIPHWWAFDRHGFGAGLTISLDGPEKSTGVRVTTTLLDFLKYQFGITPGIGLMSLILLVFTACAGWLLREKPWLDLPYLAGMGILYTLLVTPYAVTYDQPPLMVLFAWVLLVGQYMRYLQKVFMWAGVLLMYLILPFQEYSYTSYFLLIIMLMLVWIVYPYRYELRSQSIS